MGQMGVISPFGVVEKLLRIIQWEESDINIVDRKEDFKKWTIVLGPDWNVQQSVTLKWVFWCKLKPSINRI